MKAPLTPLSTKQMILQAALQLFIEKGYKDTSYEMIMKKTSLSKGAIYHHFASKDDLLVDVFEFISQYSYKDVTIITPPISNFRDLKKYIVNIKMDQLKAFSKMVGAKSMKLNKFLFIVEALS
jgi:AcrR family transcriptional regulator